MPNLIPVFALKPIYSGPSIQLLAEHFIGLAESVEFSCQVDILSLKDARMLLESLLLCGQVLVSISVLVVGNALAVNVTSDLEQSLFLFFKSDLSISDLY